MLHTPWLAPDAASADDSAASVHKAPSAQAPARGADSPDAEALDGKRTMNPDYDPRSDAGRRMILEDSFLLLATGGLLLLIVLAEQEVLEQHHDLEEVRALLGHSRIDTTQIYTTSSAATQASGGLL